jgi:hypothetical protein
VVAEAPDRDPDHVDRVLDDQAHVAVLLRDVSLEDRVAGQVELNVPSDVRSDQSDHAAGLHRPVRLLEHRAAGGQRDVLDHVVRKDVLDRTVCDRPR